LSASREPALTFNASLHARAPSTANKVPGTDTNEPPIERLLGVSQPAVSEVIVDLEQALGVRLLDRSAQGVEPTIYGDALLKRSVAVFDELKQSVRDIGFSILSNSSAAC
jgi:hypothetical protein